MTIDRPKSGDNIECRLCFWVKDRPCVYWRVCAVVLMKTWLDNLKWNMYEGWDHYHSQSLCLDIFGSYWLFVSGYGIFMSPRCAQSGSLSSCTGSKINSLNSKIAQLPTLMSTQYYLLYLPDPRYGRFILLFLDKWEIFVHNRNKRLLFVGENSTSNWIYLDILNYNKIFGPTFISIFFFYSFLSWEM